MAVTDRKVHAAALFAREPLMFNLSSLGASITALVFGAIQLGAAFLSPFPYAFQGWQIDNVSVFCTAFTGTDSIDVQIATSLAAGVLTGGVSLLTAPITPVAGSIVTGTLVSTLATRRVNKTQVLAALATTAAASSLTNVQVTVTLRPFPLDNEAA